MVKVGDTKPRASQVSWYCPLLEVMDEVRQFAPQTLPKCLSLAWRIGGHGHRTAAGFQDDHLVSHVRVEIGEHEQPLGLVVEADAESPDRGQCQSLLVLPVTMLVPVDANALDVGSKHPPSLHGNVLSIVFDHKVLGAEEVPIEGRAPSHIQVWLGTSSTHDFRGIFREYRSEE